MRTEKVKDGEENAHKLPAKISTEFEQGKLNDTSPTATSQTRNLGRRQMDVLDALVRVSWDIVFPQTYAEVTIGDEVGFYTFLVTA